MEYIKLFESFNTWYHGTYDLRELENGFEERTLNLTYIEDISRYRELQELMSEHRNTDEYFVYLKEVSSLKKDYKYKKPIFFANNLKVANTYADANRSMDYQNSEPGTIRAKIRTGKNLRISAIGKRFRFIPIEDVRKGFVSSGVDSEEFDKVLNMFNWYSSNSGIKTDIIAAIASWFDFDTIDVVGVLDSYNGGKIQSTVRMVFDIKAITIL